MVKCVAQSSRTKVSVIIPVYNGANFIIDAINCVLQQTHKDIEIIVIDDYSTDNTLSVLKQISQPITTIALSSNQGASFARNTGLKQATGDYIAFLDADDLWSPYYLEIMLSQLCLAPEYDFIYCLDNQISMGSATELISKKPNQPSTSKLSLLDVFKNPYMATAAMLFRQSMLKYVSAFDCTLKTAEDIDFVLRAAEFKPILRLNETLVEVRVRSNSLGQAVGSYKDNIEVIEQFLARNPLFKENEKNALTEIYEEIYYCWIRELLFRRNFIEFYRQSTIAMKISPSIRIFRLMIKSIPLLIISVFHKRKIP